MADRLSESFIIRGGQLVPIRSRIAFLLGCLLVTGGGMLVTRSTSMADAGHLPWSEIFAGNESHLLQTIGWLSLVEGILLLAPGSWFERPAPDQSQTQSQTSGSADRRGATARTIIPERQSP